MACIAMTVSLLHFTPQTPVTCRSNLNAKIAVFARDLSSCFDVTLCDIRVRYLTHRFRGIVLRLLHCRSSGQLLLVQLGRGPLSSPPPSSLAVFVWRRYGDAKIWMVEYVWAGGVVDCIWDKFCLYQALSILTHI